MTKDSLKQFALFLPQLEHPDFKAGDWRGGETVEPNVMTMPFVEQSEVVSAFVETAYASGWIQNDFDWGDWAQSAEATRLHDDDAAISAAAPEQLSRLLTLHIRQDRFVEGALLKAFDKRLMLRIVRRAVVLAAAPANHKGKE